MDNSQPWYGALAVLLCFSLFVQMAEGTSYGIVSFRFGQLGCSDRRIRILPPDRGPALAVPGARGLRDVLGSAEPVLLLGRARRHVSWTGCEIRRRRVPSCAMHAV